MDALFSKILQKWFYSEPLLFSVVTTHSIVKNDALSVPMRTGRLRIEYSSEILKKYSQNQIEEFLKVEVIRILLMHPYSRKPHNAIPGILFLSSDAVISQMEKISVPLCGTEYLKQKIGPFATFPDMDIYQWYDYILDLVKSALGGSEKIGGPTNFDSKDMAAFSESEELWEENEGALNDIQEQIQKAQVEQGWGSIGGGLKRTVNESADFSFDYRRALNKLRQDIVSEARLLTRMKPSRRYGFSAMGSRYNRKANVLIAVDSSGSIGEESFAHFYTAVKNIFFLGIIEKIDLIFFDVNLKNTVPVKFTKNVSIKDVKGKGGTDFQCAIDFFYEHSGEYNGMIIFTDGEASCPDFCGLKNILWIMDSRLSYERNKDKLCSSKGSSATFLPF